MSIDPLTALPPRELPQAAAPAPPADAARPAPRTAPAEERWQRALDAVRTAAEAYEQLRRHGRSLHFEADGLDVRIEVYDSKGELVRRIPPTEALALAAGETTWLA